MAQPTTQELLDTGSPYYGYFWYANGSGLWDARNGAMATKTGSGTVTATGSGGENVANSSGTTYYSTGALTTLGDPCTVGFKVKRTSASGDKGMVLGDRSSTSYYFWIRPSEVRCFGLTTANSNPDSWATFHYVRLSTGAGKLYKNGSFVADVPWTGARTVDSIMDGYAGGTYALDGALEYMRIIPGLEATAGDISSLYADPYQGLIASGATSEISATAGNAVGAIGSIVSPISAISTTSANLAAAWVSVSVSSASAIAVTTSASVGALASTGSTSNGTFTSEVLRDNTGTVVINKALNHVALYNDTTGALVVRKTGLSTDASGVFTFTDAAVVAGTTYRIDWEDADGRRRMPRKAAT